MKEKELKNLLIEIVKDIFSYSPDYANLYLKKIEDIFK